MYTQCPKCDTWFNITAAHLRAAEGMVQCSRCQNQFNALDYLSEAPPPSEEREGAATTEPVRDIGLGAVTSSSMDDADVIEMSDDDVDIIPITKNKKKSEQPRIVAERNVHVAKRGRLARLLGGLTWLSLCSAALVFLAAQAVYWLPEQNVSGWGFVRGHVCSMVNCPAHSYDRSRVRILQEKVTAEDQERTIVNAGQIINNALYEQPFPVLRMTLRDGKGNTLGERDFYADDYLVDNTGPMLAPGPPVKFRIVAVNPLVAGKWDKINVDTRLHFAPRPQNAPMTGLTIK